MLAAGRASRFGGPPGGKLTAVFRGMPLVCWAVEAALAAGLDEVVVVTGAVDLDAVLPPGVRSVGNPRWVEGQGTSLAAGIEAVAAHDAVVVGLGDQPLIPAEAWRLVAGTTGTPIAVATYGGRPRNPVRFAREVWHLLPTDGDEGARELVRRERHLVTEVACPGEPADVDTEEDLTRWS